MFKRPGGFHYHYHSNTTTGVHLTRVSLSIANNKGAADPTGTVTQRFYDLKAELDAIRVEGVARGISDAGFTTIGKSTNGREIYALKIGKGRHECLITGCYHAREWISVEVPIMLADYLVHKYPTGTPANEEEWRIKHLLDNRTVWVIPMANPDGHANSMVVNRLWRANTKRYRGGDAGMPPVDFVPPVAAGQTLPKGRKINHNRGWSYTGVDLNRNHATTDPTCAWGHESFHPKFTSHAVTSRDPADCASHDGSAGSVGGQTWCGPSAASEVETQRMEAFIGSKSIRTSLHYHSCFGIYLYPDIFDQGGPNFTRWLGAGMLKVHDQAPGSKKYDLGSAKAKLYAATGSAMDFSREASGGMPAYTPELRPLNAEKSPDTLFSWLPEDQIWPTFLENLCPALAVINAAGHAAKSEMKSLDIDSDKPAGIGQVVRNCWKVFENWTYPDDPTT